MPASHNTGNRASSNNQLLVNVQLLRFVGALLVVLYHVWEGPHQQMGMNIPFFHAISLFGFAGVDMLFVISGFIIYFTTAKPESATIPTVFIYQRLVRVYLGYWPFYVIATLAFLLTSTARIAEVNFFSSFFLLPDKTGATLINACWTLAFELYFYGLFFLLLFTRKRIQIISIMFIAIIAFNVYAAYAWQAYTWKGYKNLGAYERFFTAPWMLEFFVGCFAAHAVRKDWQGGTFLALAAGLSCFLIAIFLNVYFLDGKIAKFFNHHYRLTLFGGGTALLIYGLVNLEKRGLVFFPAFSLLFGGATYSLYLCHTIFLDALSFAGAYAWLQSTSTPLLLGLIVLIAFIQLFALAFYSQIEKPAYLWARKQIYRFIR